MVSNCNIWSLVNIYNGKETKSRENPRRNGEASMIRMTLGERLVQHCTMITRTNYQISKDVHKKLTKVVKIDDNEEIQKHWVRAWLSDDSQGGNSETSTEENILNSVYDFENSEFRIWEIKILNLRIQNSEFWGGNSETSTEENILNSEYDFENSEFRIWEFRILNSEGGILKHPRRRIFYLLSAFMYFLLKNLDKSVANVLIHMLKK